MPEATQEAVQLVNAYKEVWNETDYSRIPEVVADSFVLYDDTAPRGEVHGPDGLTEWIRGFTAAFPDFTVDIRNVATETGIVMVESRYTMTHEGEFNDIPPTGETIELEAMATFEHEDGKITEHREYHDRQSFLEQLGVAADM